MSNQDCWIRLSNDIRSRFKSPDEITNKSTLAIPYLDAVIHESESTPDFCLIIALRLRPSVPGNLQRIVPKDGAIIAGRFIPGGVSNILDNYC